MFYKELPDITEKQEEILELVFKYRFINRSQIQRFLKHKGPRRINAWLKDMVEKRYLGRIYSHKLLENTKPAIYFLQNNGILKIRLNKGGDYRAPLDQLDFKYVKKFYKDKNASVTFVNHCVSVCEFCLKLKQKERKNKKEKYEFTTKNELWIQVKLWMEEDEESFDEFKDYIPDVFIDRETSKNGEVSSTTFFLELFDPHVPRYAIRYKIDQYIKFREEEDWSIFTGLDGKFPIILLIFADQQKLNSMARYIKEKFDELYIENITFLLGTHKKILAGKKEDMVWEMVKLE
jgi:hypothetical protein